MAGNDKIKLAFFGSSRFSVFVLEELEKTGYVPFFVITTPDKPQGRGLKLTSTPVKDWATKRKIPVLDPAKLDTAFLLKMDECEGCDLFIVASYGKIIPPAVFNKPKYKTLNVHPSLLPKYRGASPLQWAILDDAKETGTTIMQLDKEMDHGPIVAQKEIHIREWPTYEEFEELMARESGRFLSEIIPRWTAGEIQVKPQNHHEATFTKKIIKENAFLDITGDQYTNFRKIQAYHEWPQAYFFIVHNGDKKRVKVTAASFENGKLKMEKVIPEGGKEMKYTDFMRGYLGANGQIE